MYYLLPRLPVTRVTGVVIPGPGRALALTPDLPCLVPSPTTRVTPLSTTPTHETTLKFVSGKGTALAQYNHFTPIYAGQQPLKFAIALLQRGVTLLRIRALLPKQGCFIYHVGAGGITGELCAMQAAHNRRKCLQDHHPVAPSYANASGSVHHHNMMHIPIMVVAGPAVAASNSP